MNVGGIPIYEMRIILIFPAAFFNDQIGNVPLLKVIGHGASNPSSADDDDRIAGNFADVIK